MILICLPQDLSRKFTIAVDDKKNENTNGSIIAIDELDVAGNVVYSTTVGKQFINDTNFYFVDVENCAELDFSEDENEVKNKVECENVRDLTEEISRSKGLPKRKRRVVTLSDHDCVNVEVVVRSE